MTTVLPMTNLTMAITAGARAVSVGRLVRTGAGCPHDHQLLPGDLKALENADLLVAIGLGYEPFLEKIEKTYAEKLKVIRLGERAELLFEKHEDRHDEGASGEKTLNPHPFTSPKQAAAMAAHLAEVLSSEDPANALTYRANSKKTGAGLMAIHERLAENCRSFANKKIVASTSLFGYLLRDIGLEQTAVLSDAHHMDLKPADLAALVTELKRNRQAAIFADDSSGARIAKMVGREIGAPVIVVNAGLSGPESPTAFADGLSQMALEITKGLNGGR